MAWLVDSLLIVLILFSPLIYGSITILPLSVIEALSFLLFFVFILRLSLKERISVVKIPALPLFLFLFLIIFQLLRLPGGLISILSPASLSLYKDFKINPLEGVTLSIYPELTLRYLLQFLSYLAVFFVVLNYIDTEKKMKRLILIIIICGFIYSLYGIMMRDLSNPPTAFSTFTNRDHFAAYLEMIAFLSIGYSFTNLSKAMRIVFTFLAAVMILAVFLTASRAGRVCFFFSFLAFVFLLRIKRPMGKTIPVVVILFLFFSFFVGVIGIGPIMQRMETLGHPFKAYAHRFETVKDSFRIIRDFPVLGAGLGTFVEIAQKYKTSDLQVTYGFSHNEPVQLLAEVGIIGFLLILLFLVSYLKNIFSLWFKRRSSFAVYLTLGCIVSIFSVILHSIFEFMFHVPANAILFFIILALGYRTVYRKEPQNLLPLPEFQIKLPKSIKISFIILLSLLLIFMESLIFRRYRAEAIFEKVKEKKITGTGIDAVMEYRKALKDIDRAIALNPMNSLYFNKKADLLSEFGLREDLKDGLQALGEFKDPAEILDLARKLYQKAINLNPTKADYHLRLGWLYSVLGEPELMQLEFKKALLLDPQNTKIHSYVEMCLGGV